MSKTEHSAQRQRTITGMPMLGLGIRPPLYLLTSHQYDDLGYAEVMSKAEKLFGCLTAASLVAVRAEKSLISRKPPMRLKMEGLRE